MAAILTREQAEKVGNRLIDTNKNFYRVCAEVAGPGDYGDDDWDLVSEVGQMFKCEECNTWQSTRERAGVGDDCKSCEEERNCEEGDDD